MLKALELSGFKSFADRTRFEFPRGISVVVGPNGSGKSNLVDAVKWVLGSQSAKSLRGKEMTDVIFNGCATRAAMGTGEVTLTLDNAEGQLAIDAREVHITRRVYRSGEGEYLINRQPCRLRDIRDLLASTGVTTEAYCIIEQGKVDSLLQSSPRDRRGIFDEAAGISQFKVKRAAAMRRMERVDQNLLRLSDIVDEVESRLRSVRAQAGKARRYRECADRLRQLRTELALIDWRALTRRLTAKGTQLAELRRRAEELNTGVVQAEALAIDLEGQLEARAKRVRELEAAAAAAREQIAAGQATLESQQVRRGDLQQEIARISEQLASMSASVSGNEHFHGAESELGAAEKEFAAARAAGFNHQERAESARVALQEARLSVETTRNERSELVRASATLAHRAKELESQRTAAAATRKQAIARIEELTRQSEGLARELALRERAEAELAAEVAAHQASLDKSEQRLAHVRRELSRADQRHRQLEGRVMRIRERIAVLSELEERLEGLGNGVHEVLRMAAAEPNGPLEGVHGIVADLFHVDVDSAPLVEVALGERTQFIVMTLASQLLERLDRQLVGVAGRVGFLGLDARVSPTALDHVDLSAEPGVMGRADRFIESAPEYTALVRRLLGRTWLVDRLSTAVRLWQTTGRGLEFVTSDGELLSADGTLIVGARQAATGMLSRRSELRACHEQVEELEKQLAQQAAAWARWDKERLQQEDSVATSVAAYTSSSARLAAHGQETAMLSARLERNVDERKQADDDSRRVEKIIEAIVADIESSRRQQADADNRASQLASQLESGEQQLAALQENESQLRAAATARQIAAARLEQRVEMIRQQAEQIRRSQQERERALKEAQERLEARQNQVTELDVAMLAGQQSLAELGARKEQLEKAAIESAADAALRQQRTDLLNRIRSDRQQLSTLQSQQHKVEVAATRLQLERQTLCDRMQEDYQIDLEAAASGGELGGRSTVADVPSPPFDREAVEQEIAQLRDQLNSIGAINLDALDELEQLETRFNTLSEQYRDLVDAKSSLERIVHRIDADSRQLFLSTLEMVRGHFQELFRRLFGGGEADIIVDETEDVLECGIEIVARPPGKEACSISLLSGGEKTLTCVALLLAVFRSKPSPFCVLDEVDAALDEMNIGRFIGVLREFLSFTQFIVVTHSKKSMAGADTLYGVTMEESGISKRVSVRFEDVSEDGQISVTALRRAA